MKKNITLAVLGAIAILSGCTKVEVNSVTYEASPITFRTVVGKATKSVSGPIATNYSTDEKFVSYARYRTAEQTAATSWAFGASTAAYIDGAIVKYFAAASSPFAALSWHEQDGTVFYWPVTGSLTFFAYSPSDVTGTPAYSDANGIKLIGHTADGKTDFMVATPAADQRNNTTSDNDPATQIGVPTVFGHKLTKIGFKCKTNMPAASGTISIDEIKIIDVYSKANYAEYDFGNDKWSTYSDNITYTAYTASASSSPVQNTALTNTAANYYTNDSGHELMLIPQTTTQFTASAATLSIKYTVTLKGTGSNSITETKTVTKTLTDIASDWGVNKYLTYVITIDPNMIYWDPTVTDWSADSDATVTL